MTTEATKKIVKIASECIRSGDQNTPSFAANLKKFFNYVASDVEGLDTLEDKELGNVIDDYVKTVRKQLPPTKVPKLSRVWMCAVYGAMVLDKCFTEENDLRTWLETTYAGISFDNTSLTTAMDHQKVALEAKSKKQGLKRKSVFFEEIAQKKRKVSLHC